MRQHRRSLPLSLSFVLSCCLLLASCGTPAANVGKVLTSGGPGTMIGTAAFGQGGALLATANPDTTITVWDTASGTRRFTFAGHGGTVTALNFSPDGKLLASGGTDKRIELWDVAAGKELRALNGSSAAVDAVAFSPDGKTVASGGQDGTVRLWDVSSGTQKQSLAASNGGVTSLAYSPDGKSLASGGRDASVQLWDTGSSKLARSFKGHKDAVGTLAFSPDSQSLASGSADKQVKLWSVGSDQEQRSLTGHTGSLLAVGFSPDGKSVATGSDDRTAKLWDAATGQTRQTLSGHTAAVPAVAFNPDGKSLLSGSRDNSAKQWDAATGTLQRSINIAPAATSAIDGLWNSNYGPVTFRTQPGTGGKRTVTGFWIQEGLDACATAVGCRGEITSGEFDSAAGRITFAYFQPWNQVKGTADLRLLNPTQISGSFSQSSGSGTWTMTRPIAGNLLSNGDFECPAIAGSYQAFAAKQTLCGWLVEAESVDLVGNLWAAASGKQSIDLSGTPGKGTLVLEVPTVPGQSYRIRFALAGNFQGDPAKKQMAVAWENRDLATLTFDTTGRSASAMGWEYHEYTVTASGSTARLAFRSLTDGAFGAVIDDVSVVPIQ